MKKSIFTIFAALAVLAACNNKPIQTGKGSLSMDVNCDNSYTEITKALSDEEIINSLLVDITRPYDGYVAMKGEVYGTAVKGKSIELGSGTYVVTARSAHNTYAGYDPMYAGSEQVQIYAGQVSTVNLIAKITNMKVTVNLSENFKKELSDYTVTVSNGSASLQWSKNASVDDFANFRPGFFTVAPLDIVVTGHRAIDDTDASTKFSITNVKAADHHILTLDAKVTGHIGPDGDNTEGMKITVDHSLTEINKDLEIDGVPEIPVPGGDDSEGGEEVKPEKPSIVWEANPTFADTEISDNMDVNLMIYAPGKFKTFVVNVSENFQPAISAVAPDKKVYLDLINDAAALQETIGFANLPMGDDILGKTELAFSLSGLVPMISKVMEAGSKVTFILNVSDEYDQTLSQAISFIVPATASASSAE